LADASLCFWAVLQLTKRGNDISKNIFAFIINSLRIQKYKENNGINKNCHSGLRIAFL
jgi:hypothetical protein